MKLATTTGDFGAYASSQQESMRYIRQAGFRFLDYNFGSDYGKRNGVYSEDWKSYLEDVKKTADEIGAAFVQAHSPMGTPLAEGNDAFTQDTIRCVEACGILGIPNLVVHSGYLPDISKDEAFERNKQFYSKLFPMAERYGVNVLVENFNRMTNPNVYWIDNASDLRALIDYVDHPLFHACWDAGHGNMQEMPQDESLRIVGEHVYALHIQDNLGDRDTHLIPYFGSLNMDSLMNGLLEIGYKGYFTFETGMLPSPNQRRPYEKDKRLLRVPLDLRIEAEKFLYAIGRCTLEAYDCYEE
ncbi:MAG: sugar phosphate isomerase/epimerase [Clostridia bacterium]|nr:sugar phosphate isomerase/epimerase [Clostridia bacterium]